MKVKHLEIMLYPESGYDVQGILSVISKYKSIKKYCIILHDQDRSDEDEFDEEGNLIAKQGDIKPHYHVYLNFGNSAIDFSSAATWFGVAPNYVEKVKGHMVDVIRYYTHEKKPEKHQYSYDDIIANFDVEEFVKQESSKVNIDEIIELCANGTITRRNLHEHIDSKTYVKHKARIEAAWEYGRLKRKNELGGHRSMECIWIYGKTGTGKSTLAMLFAEERNLSYCITASGKDPVSDYYDEDVLIIDDIRPDDSYSFSQFLKMFDPNIDSPVASRYHNKDIFAQYILVTNPYPLEEFCRLIPNQNFNEDPKQFYRRFSQQWEVLDDKVVVHIFDEKLGKFVCSQARYNPVPEYVQKQKIPRPEPAENILDDIGNSFEQEPVLERGDSDDEIPF